MLRGLLEGIGPDGSRLVGAVRRGHPRGRVPAAPLTAVKQFRDPWVCSCGSSAGAARTGRGQRSTLGPCTATPAPPGYLYQAVLRGELSAAFGVGWAPALRGQAEVPGGCGWYPYSGFGWFPSPPDPAAVSTLDFTKPVFWHLDGPWYGWFASF